MIWDRFSIQHLESYRYLINTLYTIPQQYNHLNTLKFLYLKNKLQIEKIFAITQFFTINLNNTWKILQINTAQTRAIFLCIFQKRNSCRTSVSLYLKHTHVTYAFFHHINIIFSAKAPRYEGPFPRAHILFQRAFPPPAYTKLHMTDWALARNHHETVLGLGLEKYARDHNERPITPTIMGLAPVWSVSDRVG